MSDSETKPPDDLPHVVRVQFKAIDQAALFDPSCASPCSFATVEAI